jgi:hypothetical protein
MGRGAHPGRYKDVQSVPGYFLVVDLLLRFVDFETILFGGSSLRFDTVKKIEQDDSKSSFACAWEQCSFFDGHVRPTRNVPRVVTACILDISLRLDVLPLFNKGAGQARFRIRPVSGFFATFVQNVGLVDMNVTQRS